ncbi:MAG: hypothetical protein IJH39_11615 [Clostridia bacterium]|nr:hypothetical protein [Clostridia bacterium]
METLEQAYVRTVCSLCKNRENCQEELRRKIDGTIKCEKYKKIKESIEVQKE